MNGQESLCLLERLESALAARSNEEHDRVITGEEVTGRDLASLSNYRQHVQRLSKELSRAQQALDAHMHRQKAVVIESERKVRLLEKLRDKRLTAWQSACDRELEELAADSYLARLAAMRRLENRTEPAIVD